MQLPIAEENPTRAYKRYSGCYLCFARLGAEESLSVSWLHIRALSRTLNTSDEAVPLPRFTWLLKNPEQVDPQTRRRLVGGAWLVRLRSVLGLLAHSGGSSPNTRA